MFVNLEFHRSLGVLGSSRKVLESLLRDIIAKFVRVPSLEEAKKFFSTLQFASQQAKQKRKLKRERNFEIADKKGERKCETLKSQIVKENESLKLQIVKANESLKFQMLS